MTTDSKPTIYSLARMIAKWNNDFPEIDVPSTDKMYDSANPDPATERMYEIVLHAEALCIAKGALPEEELPKDEPNQI